MGVKKCLGSRKCNWRGMPTISGVNFRGLKPWRNKAEKFAKEIRHHDSLRNLWAIFLNIARPK